MHHLFALLKREPAAIGALLASVLPALVVFGVLDVDEQAVAALVVAVNAVTGFLVRLVVAPTHGTGEAAPAAPGPGPA